MPSHLPNHNDICRYEHKYITYKTKRSIDKGRKKMEGQSYIYTYMDECALLYAPILGSLQDRVFCNLHEDVAPTC